MEVGVDEPVSDLLWRPACEVDIVENQNFRVILEVVHGRDRRAFEGMFDSFRAAMVKVAFESVQPCHLRMFTHKPRRLDFFITIKVLFGVVYSPGGNRYRSNI